ncbi:MAG TPA: hypothetical protein GXX46_06025 [Peptococcaceae bacterium]|nr:hypothetical protein [Peptococcaceae bacterium]
MKNKKLVLFISLIFLVFISLSGCGGGKPADTPSAPAQSEPAAENPGDSPEKEPTGEPAGEGDELGKRLSKVYTDMMQSGKYYMKYRVTVDVEGQKATAVIEAAVDGDDSAIISSIDGGKSHMIFKDDKTYLIDYESKSVLVMGSGTREDMDEAEIETDGLTYKGAGHGEFLGKNLLYEEYTTDTGTLKFYFDGNKLVGMEVIEEGISQTMEILEMKADYPSDIFTIPADFTLEEMP